MTNRPMHISLDEVRSYATEENLWKGLAKFGLDQHRPVICKTADNRWTAIFSFATARALFEENYVGFASQHGFMTTN